MKRLGTYEHETTSYTEYIPKCQPKLAMWRGRVVLIESPHFFSKSLSMFLLNEFMLSQFTTCSGSLFQVLTTLLPKLNFKTSFLQLSLYNFMQWPLVTPFPLVKNVSSSSPSFPVNILNTSSISARVLLVSKFVKPVIPSLSSYDLPLHSSIILVALLWTLSSISISLARCGRQVWIQYWGRPYITSSKRGEGVGSLMMIDDEGGGGTCTWWRHQTCFFAACQWSAVHG